MRIARYTDWELGALEAFLKETIAKKCFASSRGDLQGVASGILFNLLKQQHKELALKVGSRSQLVSVAKRLRFAINGGAGGIGLRGTGIWEYIDLPRKTQLASKKPGARPATSRRPSEFSDACSEYGQLVPSTPAIVSVVGWHGGESLDAIVARKARDVANTGRTYWVLQSWKAKTETVQAFGRPYSGATVYFVKGGAIPAGTAQAATQISEDRQHWSALPEGIGPVTGKLNLGTALVLDNLAPCPASIDLWQFVEHPNAEPVRFMQGASTACLIPAMNISVGMKSRYRRILAIGRLASPFAVYLR